MSGPTEGERELYLAGSCHVLATALHRRFGWTFAVVTDPEETCWSDPADRDNYLPAVVHVYAVDDEGWFWDILGRRDATDALRELAARHPDVGQFDVDRVGSAEALAMYVDGPDGIDRPLHAIAEADVAEAAETMLRLHGGMLPASDAELPRLP